MCVPMVVASAILTGIGTAVSMAGSLAQGQQAQAMANAQAQAYEQSAQAERKSSAYEMARTRHQQELTQASARAQVGASGVGFAGSPAAVLTANAAQGELDIQAIQYGSQLRQNQLGTQAALSRFGGAQAKQASYINAAGDFISGISQLHDPNKAVKFGTSEFA